MLEWIKDHSHLESVRAEHADYFVLLFWGEFSEGARRALSEVEQFAAEHEDVPVFVVDVQKVKGVHRQFDVERVPTVVAVEKGKVTKSVEGVQSARFYALHFAGAATVGAGRSAKRRPRRVIVYSGPGCPPCGLLKNYLRRHGVAFREIDISRDERAAREIVRRSGQMAVPQTDVDGRLVVGFDRAKLSRLLGIQEEERG